MAGEKEIVERVERLQLAAAGPEAEETLRKVIDYVRWHLELINGAGDPGSIKTYVQNTLFVLDAVEKRLSSAYHR